MERESTLSIAGIFALIIILSHFGQYIQPGNVLDDLGFSFTNLLGQLMVVPFLFYSGYGVFESIKTKGSDYISSVPKNRILKVYLSYFVAWLIYAVVALVTHANYGVADYLFALVGASEIGGSAWYVVIIIAMYMFSYVSFKICGHSKQYFLLLQSLLTFAFFIVLKKFNVPYFWWNTMFCYVFGIVFSMLKDRIVGFLEKNPINKIVALLASLVCFVVCYWLLPKVFSSSDIREVIYIFTGFFFCLSIVFFTYLFQIRNKMLVALGKNSFWLYIFHTLPMNVLQNFSWFSNRYVYFLGCLAITAVLATVVGFLFNKTWKLFNKTKVENLSENINVKLGIIVSYLTMAVGVIGGLIVTPRILEQLGDEQYGLNAFATSITSWLTIVTGALAASYLRFANQDNKKFGDVNRINHLYNKINLIFVSAIIIISVGAVSLLFIFNINLSNYSQSENNLIRWLILISGVGISFSLLFNIYNYFLTYKKQFVFLRFVALVVQLVTYIAHLAIVFLTRSVVAMTISTIVISFLSGLITMWFAISKEKISFKSNPTATYSPVLRNIIIFSSFILINTTVNQINDEAGKTILGIMVNAEAVTDYTLSRYFITYLTTLSLAISATYTPKVYEMVTYEQHEKINELFLKVSKLQLIILLMVVGGFVSCGYDFMSLWLGKEKSSLYFYAIPLFAVYVIPLSCNLGIEIQRAKNLHIFRAISYAIIAIVNIVISIVLIAFLPKQYAIWGVIAGIVFSIFVGNSVVMNIYNERRIGLPMKRYYINLFKTLAFAAVGAIPCLLMQYLFGDFGLSEKYAFFIKGFLFVLLYGLCLFIFERKFIASIVGDKFKKKQKADIL